jgi:TolA-binding protein
MALNYKGHALHEQGLDEDATVVLEELLRRYGKEPEVEVREQIAYALYQQGAIFEFLRQRSRAVATYETLFSHFSQGESAHIDKYLGLANAHRERLR